MLKSLILKFALNKILAHSINLNGLNIKKGKILNKNDILLIDKIGLKKVLVYEKSIYDIEENKAANKIANFLSGKNVIVQKPINGRADLFSSIDGMLLFEKKIIKKINFLNDDVAVSMLKK